MARKPIGWFEIYVEDMQRARAFYEGVFAVKLEKMDMPDDDSGMEMWMFPGTMDESDGASGALVKMDGFSPGGNGVVIYFVCDDCAVEAGQVGDFGGEVIQEKMSIGEYGFAALAIDSEGNTIGLHSMA